MDHILGRIRGVKAEDIKAALTADVAKHSKEGLVLRHVWHNADDPDETLFIFTANDLEHAREFIKKEHSQARKENPNANLPELLYLRASPPSLRRPRSDDTPNA
jgi:hypothetical protein